MARQPQPETPPSALQPHRRGGALRAGGGGVVLVAVALIVGLQLGALPWRYRRQFWQLQGALLGGAAGFLLGRITAGRREPPE